MYVTAQQSESRAAVRENGKFILYKYLHRMGEEKYELRVEGNSLLLDAKFELNFVGDKVPLAATMRMRSDYTPTHLEIKGRTSTRSEIDRLIDIQGSLATIRERGRAAAFATVRAPFFVSGGYAPISLQQIKPLESGRYVVGGAKVFDGIGSPVVMDATIVVEDGQIVAAGPRSFVS